MYAACCDEYDFSFRLPVQKPTTQQLGVIACILLLLTSVFGCSKISVAQEIVNWTPTIEQQINAALAAGALLLPVDAPIFALATAGLQGAGTLLVAAAQSYLNSPNASTLQSLQNAIAAMVGAANNGLLQAARIVNPKSQALALLLMNGIAAAVNAILSLVEQISSKTAIKKMALKQRVKLAQVSMLMNPTLMQNAQDRVCADMGITLHSTPMQFIAQQQALGF
jgi:hypothetical protein